MSDKWSPASSVGRAILITGIHHFSIIASSEASIEFYEKLGFHEYKRIERHYDTVVLMSGYGVGLEIVIDPAHPQRSSPEPTGLRNLSLQVDSIDSTAFELGVVANPMMTDWIGIKYCLITDPDGTVIQLHE